MMKPEFKRSSGAVAVQETPKGSTPKPVLSRPTEGNAMVPRLQHTSGTPITRRTSGRSREGERIPPLKKSTGPTWPLLDATLPRLWAGIGNKWLDTVGRVVALGVRVVAERLSVALEARAMLVYSRSSLAALGEGPTPDSDVGGRFWLEVGSADWGSISTTALGLKLRPGTAADEVVLGQQLTAQLSLPFGRGEDSRNDIELLSDLQGSFAAHVRKAQRATSDRVHYGLQDTLTRTVEAVRSLILWLEVEGYQITRADDAWLSRFALKSFLDLIADQYEDRMKFLCALIQAHHLDDHHELPPRPSFVSESDRHFLGGGAFAWFETRVHRDPSRSEDSQLQRLRLLNAITGLKKRQPPIPSVKLKQATAKWYEKIFGEQRAPHPLSHDRRARVEAAIKHIVKELTKVSAFDELVGILSERADFPLSVPGTAARLGHDRASGGAFEAIRTEIRDLSVSYSRHEPLRFCDSQGNITAVRFPIPDGLAELMADGVRAPIVVEPVALPEPFKVRMISKGSAAPYWGAQAIQKCVHQALQRIPCFRLTRETPDRDIVDLLNIVVGVQLLKMPESLVSGDYQAATDNLDPWISDTVGRLLSEALGLTPEVQDLFIRALTGHTSDTGRTQTWGQLMGSNVSFPVLCIANAALTLAALTEVWEKDRRHSSRAAKPTVWNFGVLVNGDDIGFRATREEIEAWKSYTSSFGLAPSVGKNFISRDFIQLNSKMFVMRSEVIDVVGGPLSHYASPFVAAYSWQKIPQASLAVLAPPREVLFDEWCLSAPEWQRTFLDSFNAKEQDRLNTLWLDVWSDYLGRLPSGLMNWWLPRELGGFGLHPTRPVVINEGQAHAAAYLRDFTTAESYRDAKLIWLQPDATTTVHADSNVLLRELEKLGLVEWRWARPGEKPPDWGCIEQSMYYSLYSQTGSRTSPRYLYDWGWKPVPGTQGSLEPKKTTARAGSGKVSAEDARKTECHGWLTRSITRLRRAGRLTGRSISAEEAARWVGRKAGWFLTPGVNVLSTPIKVDITDLRPAYAEPYDDFRFMGWKEEAMLGVLESLPPEDHPRNVSALRERIVAQQRVVRCMRTPIPELDTEKKQVGPATFVTWQVT